MSRTFIITLIILAVIALIGGFFLNRQLAQPAKHVYRVVISSAGGESLYGQAITGIKDGFARAGYLQGRDIVYDVQFTHGDAAIARQVAERYAAGNDDLLITLATSASQPAAKYVRGKPVLFGIVADPVFAGVVHSLSHPGENISGVRIVLPYAQQLSLVRKLLPNAKTVGVLHNPNEPNSISALEATVHAANALGLKLIVESVVSTNQVGPAVRTLAPRVDAVYLLAAIVVLNGAKDAYNEAFAAHKMLITPAEADVPRGAIGTYGNDLRVLGRSIADMGVKVLQGESPGNLPVVNADETELVLNLDTAKNLGITIPPELLKEAKFRYTRTEP